MLEARRQTIPDCQKQAMSLVQEVSDRGSGRADNFTGPREWWAEEFVVGVQEGDQTRLDTGHGRPGTDYGVFGLGPQCSSC